MWDFFSLTKVNWKWHTEFPSSRLQHSKTHNDQLYYNRKYVRCECYIMKWRCLFVVLCWWQFCVTVCSMVPTIGYCWLGLTISNHSLSQRSAHFASQSSKYSWCVAADITEKPSEILLLHSCLGLPISDISTDLYATNTFSACRFKGIIIAKINKAPQN